MLFVLRSGVGCLSFSLSLSLAKLCASGHQRRRRDVLQGRDRGPPTTLSTLTHISSCKNCGSSCFPTARLFYCPLRRPPTCVHTCGCQYPTLLSFLSVQSLPNSYQHSLPDHLTLLIFYCDFANTRICGSGISLNSSDEGVRGRDRGRNIGEKQGWIKQTRVGGFAQLASSCMLSRRLEKGYVYKQLGAQPPHPPPPSPFQEKRLCFVIAERKKQWASPALLDPIQL